MFTARARIAEIAVTDKLIRNKKKSDLDTAIGSTIAAILLEEIDQAIGSTIAAILLEEIDQAEGESLSQLLAILQDQDIGTGNSTTADKLAIHNLILELKGILDLYEDWEGQYELQTMLEGLISIYEDLKGEL